MNARDAITNAAEANGWSADTVNGTTTFQRGADRVTLSFTTSGAVNRAGIWIQGEHHAGYGSADTGKREAVLRVLETPDVKADTWHYPTECAACHQSITFVVTLGQWINARGVDPIVCPSTRDSHQPEARHDSGSDGAAPPRRDPSGRCSCPTEITTGEAVQANYGEGHGWHTGRVVGVRDGLFRVLDDVTNSVADFHPDNVRRPVDFDSRDGSYGCNHEMGDGYLCGRPALDGIDMCDLHRGGLSITVHTVSYAPWEDGADERERLEEDTYVMPVDSVEDAADYLDRIGVTEHSTYPGWGGIHGWYLEVDPYQHPYTGILEEKSAHLEGFTAEESRRVHGLVTGAVVPLVKPVRPLVVRGPWNRRKRAS